MKTVPQEDAPSEKEGRSAGGFVLWIFISAVLYVLSTGPVVRLMGEGKISESTVDKIYAPLVWLSHTSIGAVVLEPFFHWYGEKLWGWGSSSKQRP